MRNIQAEMTLNKRMELLEKIRETNGNYDIIYEKYETRPTCQNVFDEIG